MRDDIIFNDGNAEKILRREGGLFILTGRSGIV